MNGIVSCMFENYLSDDVGKGKNSTTVLVETEKWRTDCEVKYLGVDSAVIYI